MIKYENETILQVTEFTVDQTRNITSFLEKNNLLQEVALKPSDYLYVADSLGEDDSLSTLMLLVDWLQQAGVTYNLVEVSNRLNLKREINYTILKNKWIRNKELDEESEFGLETADDYWD